MLKPLTQRQQTIYDFLKSEIATKGYSPAIREICEAANLKSTSTVHTYLEILEKKGYIRRSPTKTRSIEILDEDFYAKLKETIEAPFLRRVTPELFMTIDNIERTVLVSRALIKCDEVFVMRVPDNCLKDIGILQNDNALIRRQSRATPGEIVLAFDDRECHLKVYSEDRNAPLLLSKNPEFKNISGKKISIAGRLIGVYKDLLECSFLS